MTANQTEYLPIFTNRNITHYLGKKTGNNLKPAIFYFDIAITFYTINANPKIS